MQIYENECVSCLFLDIFSLGFSRIQEPKRNSKHCSVNLTLNQSFQATRSLLAASSGSGNVLMPPCHGLTGCFSVAKGWRGSELSMTCFSINVPYS